MSYFMYRREEFLAHYHKRSTQVNETLAKMLCHYLVVLIHEMYALGIDPAFWATESR